MYGSGFDIDHLCGKTKDVLAIKDVADTTYRGKQSVYGFMKDLSPIINTQLGIYSKRYQIEEIV